MDLLRFKRALSLRDSGKVAAALQEFRSLEPSDGEEEANILSNEAECLRQMGQVEKAWGCLRESRRVAPQNEILLYLDYQEAMLLWEEKRFRASLERLQTLWEQNRAALEKTDHRPLYEGVQIRRGLLLAEQGRFVEARPVLEEAISFPLPIAIKCEVAYSLAVCYSKAAMFDRAEEMFLASLECAGDEPYVTLAHYDLGVIYFLKGAHAKAIHEFEQCVPHMAEADLRPDFVHRWLAKAWRALGDDDKAKHFEKLAKS